MKNTKWKAIIIKNAQNGYELGYETPATITSLKEIQQYGIWVEVVGKKPSTIPQLIRPDNTDTRSFAPDQKFRIMENNKNFNQFEKVLWGDILPEHRFDKLVKWNDSDIWEKTDRGYSLRLSPLLSDEKKEELEENLKELAVVKNGHISISGNKNIEAIEFMWKCASEQNNLKTHLQEASNHLASMTSIRGVRR